VIRPFLLTFTFCLLTFSAFAQSVPIPQVITIDPRRAGALGAMIVCGLLLLQYAHRRRPFILPWAFGWLLIVPALLVLNYGSGGPAAGRAVVGLSQLLGVATSASFLWSADLYRQTQYLPRRRLNIFAAVAAWFLVAPPVFGTATVLVPGYALNAVLLAWAATMYTAVLLERRMLGAGLVAFVLFGLAITNVTTALSLTGIAASPQIAFDIYVSNVVLLTLGAVGIHLLIFEDMTYELRMTNRRLEAAREELLQAAITDPLTGCHNRRFLEQVMDRELKRHARFSLPLAMLFIDIDRFKAVNDTLGHEAGDRVLQYVAHFLKRYIREADYVFRWGGDEFLVLITCTGEEAARKAGVLKTSFDAAPEAIDLPPGIGLSVGWVEVPQETADLMPLVREADERMYRDKQRI
jgi:diguanylate cyclase (GGDEF)-like protein